MSQLPAIASIPSINKQLAVIAARLKVLTQYAALSVADRDIYILLEDVYDGIKALDINDYDSFTNLKADFITLNYYERDVLQPDFDNSMHGLSLRFEALDKALSDRADFERAVYKLQAMGVAHE